MRLSIIFTAIFLSFMGHGLAQKSERGKLKSKITILEAQNGFTPKDTTYINLLTDLGKQLRYFNSDSLYILSKKALSFSKAIGYKKGEANTLALLGIYYSDKGENQEAIRLYRKALALANSIKDTDKIINIQNGLAGEYAYMGDYAKALNVYLISIELAEKEDKKLMLSIMNENIADLYATQKDYDQALSFYQKVKKINAEIGNPRYAAETMSNIASLYADMNKLDYAMFNVNKSIVTFESQKITDWLAYAYEIKGKIYLKQDKFTWALYWYNQSEMLHKKIEDERGKIDLMNGMAEAYYGLKNDSISEVYALEAFEISKKIKFKEGIKKCAQTLYKINKNKSDYAASIAYLELYQRISDTLSRNENKKSLTMLRTKVAYEEQKLAIMQENEKALQKQRGYIYAALIFLLIIAVIAFLIYRNQKAQKILNLKLNLKKTILEKREKELKGLNTAKDKLFSIIGHDLRGPIGALQGILKMYTAGEVKKEEFLSFIPKLTDDVDEISFTLNNLLSWGQSQMKGMITKPIVGHLENIVEDNINLLSKIAENKSIRIMNRVERNTLIFSDINQIDVVVRNLISNALKFTPENGMITIEALSKKNSWEVLIKDTGIGMDQNTVDKLFKEDANFTTHGTNNEKGTGLGLSLCKEMVGNNKGHIWAESIPRKGTCFHFTIPKGEKKLKRVV